VDETYVKVGGRCRYVYRAIDQFGQVIDVYGSPRRDATAAHRFFARAIGATKVAPGEVVTDRAATYPMCWRSCSQRPGAYRQTRARFPDRLAMPPFPEPGGVLPLGRTDNGDELYWVTQGHADDWPVALVESRAALQELHAMPVPGFLTALAANQLTSRILPADVLGRPRHQFTPLN
jgi:hypothetical protein